MTMTTKTLHPGQTLLRPGSLTERIAWRIERKEALGVILVLFIFSLVGWLYLTQANTTAAANLRVEEYRHQITLLERQNAKLELEIAEWEALPRVEQRAREIGFGPPETSVYLSVPGLPVVDSANMQVNEVDK
jgi:hypothetical protein